jgi:putative ABC transport system substrate-binding protein
MRRREFIKLLGGTATAWPLAVRAQTAQPVVGYLAQGSPEGTADTVQLRAFRLGLKSTGFVEGQNVVVEYRWAEGRNDKFPALLADLIGRQVAGLSRQQPLRFWLQRRRPTQYPLFSLQPVILSILVLSLA